MYRRSSEVWPGLSMKINHVLHQRFFASASFKTSTDFFANNYLQHARGAILLDNEKVLPSLQTCTGPVWFTGDRVGITKSGLLDIFP